MSSSVSSYQTVQYQQAYRSSANHGSHQLVSGMTSAGAICTTQIRDAREREKREIGILNDRLADYIEKVRFLKAQNHVLEHDIDILRRGFSGGGQISTFFESEVTHCKQSIQQYHATKTKFENEISHITSEIDVYRHKWIEALNKVKAHREDHDVNLDKLAQVEAQIALFNRKIRIVDEDVLRIRRENGAIQSDIGVIRSKIHSEISMKNEHAHSVQSLIQRLKVMETENSSYIEKELIYIRRDTTLENRDYFRHELQAAMRDIRANYEAISIRNREELEIWYHKKIEDLRRNSGYVRVDFYNEELVQIRSTLSSVRSRCLEIESRNSMLTSTIEDLRRQQTEESRIFEALLVEKDEQVTRMKERCTELSLEMEKLCDNEVSLHAELERYRALLNGANVTTYLSNGSAGAHRSVVGATTTTTTHHQTTGYTSGYTSGHTAGYSSGSRGITVGGNIGGISVGGHIGGISVGGHINGSHVSGSVASDGYQHSSSHSHYSSNH